MFQKDSHFKAVYATSMRVCQQYPKAQGQFFAVDAQFGDDDLPIDVLRVGIGELDILGDCDFLFCCLGGYLLNKVIKYYQQTQTKIISLFPGVVSHYQLDAFISRFNADQVWLNCRADYELYTKLCQVFGVKNNGILYGASWFIDIPSQQSHINSSTIFFEQTQIINNLKIARQVKQQLGEIIQNNPNRPFIYKMRHNVYNEYLAEIRQYVGSFQNVAVVDDLTIEDISDADTYISISSSAIIEGVLLGKQCWLLSRSYLNNDAIEIFKDSHIFLDSPTNQAPNLNWVNSRICPPKNSFDISNMIKQQSIHFKKRSLVHIIGWLICMTWQYPKIWQLCFQNRKLKSIQKSLEYL